MFRVVHLLVLFSFAASGALAGESFCSKLATKVDGPEDNYRPPLEAVVTGKERVNFFTAPNPKCKMKGVFVIAGDYLTVYRDYRGWANVMFIAKGGDDVVGWVPKERTKIVGQYGRNP